MPHPIPHAMLHKYMGLPGRLTRGSLSQHITTKTEGNY